MLAASAPQFAFVDSRKAASPGAEGPEGWREIPNRRQVGATFRGLEIASRMTRTRHAHNRTCSDLFIASPF